MKIISIVIGSLFFLTCCNDTLKCERHFIPNGFIGKVKIYFNKKNGQRQFDKDGCIIYNISTQGECLSSLPYKEGLRYINNTFRYFEIINKDSVREIPEFDKYAFLDDTVNNMQKKYVFFTASGYQNPTGSNPNHVFEYHVDYGSNYKNY